METPADAHLEQALARVAAAAGADAAVLAVARGERARLFGAALARAAPRLRQAVVRCVEGELHERLRAGATPVVACAGAPPRSLPAFASEAGFARCALVPVGAPAGRPATFVLLLARGEGPISPEAATRDQALVERLELLGRALDAEDACATQALRRNVVGLVARGVLARLELDEVFPELIQLVGDHCPCDLASIAVYRPDEDEFELASVYPRGTVGLVRRGTRIAARESALAAAFRADRDHTLDKDTRESPLARSRLLAQAGIISALYVPVGDGAVRRAVLCLGRSVPDGFSEEDIDLVRDITPFVGIALRNADVYRRAKDAYEDLARAQARLIQAERVRALGDLAGSLAHELGNVLALVASHADLLGRRIQDPALLETIEQCHAAVDAGHRAVQRVLDLVGSGAYPLPGRERARLDEIALAVVRDAAARAKARDGEARWIFDTTKVSEGVVAVADAAEVREAVEQLVRNALEAMPSGGRISVEARAEGERSIVAVEDEGPGVPAGLVERIYEPFFTTKSPSHSGLGLALVHGVAARRGGAIEHHARQGGGARFVLAFPRPDAEAPVAAPDGPRPLSLLLVEDEPSLGRALRELMTIRGHRVDLAHDVEGALAATAKQRFDVVITDLGLPGRSGWELVAALRDRPAAPPVVVLSGWGPLVDQDEARRRGAAAVLSKPVRDDDLARVVEGFGPGGAA